MNPTLHRLYVGLFFLVGIASLILLIHHGLDYYSLPLEERFFSSQHQALKPSGAYGHGFGIIGTLMMIVGVSVYMMRKRKIFTFGYLKHWLEFHIFLCTVGPLFVLFHTAFKFGGIVQISFWSMVAVVLSGVIGRFIYIQIPRTIQGRELSMQELSQENDEINSSIEKQIGNSSYIAIQSMVDKMHQASLEKRSLVTNLFFNFFMRRKELKKVKNEIISAGITDKSVIKSVLKLANQKLLLQRRIDLLKVMQGWFHYWHIVHLPFAITMFVIMIIHVIVTIVFGYKWIF